MGTAREGSLIPGVARVPASGGTDLSVVGDRITIKVDGDATAGAYSVFEEVTPAGGGPPPHWHEQAEVFRVLEGDVEFADFGGGDGPPALHAARAGDVVTIPPRRVHTFRNAGEEPSRVLVLVQPAGIERFFRAVDELATTGGRGGPAPEEVVALGERHGVHFVV